MRKAGPRLAGEPRRESGAVTREVELRRSRDRRPPESAPRRRVQRRYESSRWRRRPGSTHSSQVVVVELPMPLSWRPWRDSRALDVSNQSPATPAGRSVYGGLRELPLLRAAGWSHPATTNSTRCAASRRARLRCHVAEAAGSGGALSMWAVKPRVALSSRAGQLGRSRRADWWGTGLGSICTPSARAGR